jgi:hypothetical protein
MKRLLLAVVLLLPLVALANPVACPAGSSSIAWTTLVSQGGCEAGDLEYTNFQVLTGSLDSNVSATISVPNAGDSYSSLFNLNDANYFSTAFSISYVVTVDPLALPSANNWQVVESSTGLQDNGGGPLATITKALSNGASGSTYSTWDPSLGYTYSGAQIILESTSFTVTDTFTISPGTSKIADVSNEFTQEIVPEPSTMLLLGGALIGLGVIGRKRRKSL